MEHKLYYKDPYLKKFTAKVLCQKEDEQGQVYVVLGQTAFYPTGGGQPFDTGKINGVEVTGVEEIDGQIRHYLAAPLPDDQSEATGIIDWNRRFDHMQQHTGQHILSASFEQLFDATTIGFHMGQETVTIDLEVEDLTWEQAGAAEELANRIVFENREITARFVEPEELAELPLRKPPSVQENIRIVTVHDFDYSACGGTHPARTGEVGPIKILGWERYKGNIRLQFLCGLRTLHALREKHLILRELSRQLSSAEADLPAQVDRLVTMQKELERSLRDANEKLLEMEAHTLLENGIQDSDVRLVSAVFNGRPLQDLQKLARFVTENDDTALVLLVTGEVERVQFVCACGENIGIPMNEVAKTALPYINGKGGGNPKMAQGGGNTERTQEELLEHLLGIMKQKIE
jgi:alanyl-tRNA synthetase